MSLGRTSRKSRKKSKKSKRSHARHNRNRKPYKRKKVGLRKRAPGQPKYDQARAHKAFDAPVYIQRNRNAAKAKNAVEACIAIPGRKDAGGEAYACASGKNPRSAIGKAFKKAGSAIGTRTGTFAGVR